MTHHPESYLNRALAGASLISAVALTLGATTAVTQAQGLTSPRGFHSVEGNSDFATFFVPRRLQQVDATQIGRPVTIKSLSFRRNGTFAGRNAFTRTGKFTVLIGHGNYASLRSAFAQNYSSTPLTAFTTKTVSIPDWTTKPSTPPAPFDLKLPFDTPFPYNGTQALVFDVVADGLSRSGDMYVDRENRSVNRQPGTTLGTGCLATGRSSTYNHYLALWSYAPGQSRGLRIQHSGGSAPTGAPVTLLLGATDPQASLPGLCGIVRAQPTVTLPRTPASASGYLSTQYIDVPFQPGLVGGTLYSQYVSPDAGQSGLPLALSNGRSTVVPARPQELRCAYHFARPAATSASIFPGMGVVVELGL